ncbi:hypothetical protein TNCV_469831 [Trichonephila clavipes]|nr:hypothetical protein TNCV_469831 [Trichonephila clavipes]
MLDARISILILPADTVTAEHYKMRFLNPTSDFYEELGCGSLMVKATDSRLACHELEPSIASQPCKGADARNEAHFWLNGYVNKQNCRIWSEANPQVYVETPLHPEKLTVWCALWAGGILLQKR